MNSDKIYFISAMVAILALALYAAITISNEAICLEHGWASSKTTYTLKGYCIRKENEYEITKPLLEIVNDN